MSYSRWSNSNWYSFYNCNGKLSLWYAGGEQLDIKYSDCKEMTHNKIIDIYKCSSEDADEALLYIQNFINDYEKENK